MVLYIDGVVVEWYTQQTQNLPPGRACGFESHRRYGLLAQLVEQRTFNPKAQGSIP